MTKFRFCDLHNRLENPDAPETKEFVTAEIELANSVLAECPNRNTLNQKITALNNFPRYGCPSKVGNKFSYSHNSGLQAQSVVYIQVFPGFS